MGTKLDFAIGVLNGAIGDYLAKTENGLTIDMELMDRGSAIPIERAALANAVPAPSSRVVVLVHGLMCTESVWELPGGGDYGAFLSRDFDVSPLYLRYNSGLAIADNGAALSRLLDRLMTEWPVPITEIIPLGFSMGGLVIRSACHVASLEELSWLSLVKRALYVGTPHLGAPLERVGRVLAKLLEAVPDPYTRLIADIANLRSDGVKDLGDADIRHDDRARRVAEIKLRDARHPVPLLPEIRHYLAAGSLSIDPRLASLFGDVMVPVPSATDGAVTTRETLALPPDHVKIFPGLAHMTMAHHPDVYAALRTWMEKD